MVTVLQIVEKFLLYYLVFMFAHVRLFASSSLSKSIKKRKCVTMTLLLCCELHHCCLTAITCKVQCVCEVPREGTFTCTLDIFRINSPVKVKLTGPSTMSELSVWRKRNRVKAFAKTAKKDDDDDDYWYRFLLVTSLGESVHCAFCSTLCHIFRILMQLYKHTICVIHLSVYCVYLYTCYISI